MEGKVSPKEILNDYILLFTSKGSPEPDDDTILAPELIDNIIKDLQSNGNIPRHICYFDKETNSIKPGIPFRS